MEKKERNLYRVVSEFPNSCCCDQRIEMADARGDRIDLQLAPFRFNHGQIQNGKAIGKKGEKKKEKKCALKCVCEQLSLRAPANKVVPYKFY